MYDDACAGSSYPAVQFEDDYVNQLYNEDFDKHCRKHHDWPPTQRRAATMGIRAMVQSQNLGDDQVTKLSLSLEDWLRVRKPFFAP